MAGAEAAGVMIDPARAGLKQHHMKTSTVVFMIFCLCAAGAYGIEEMIPQAGPGLTLVMLMLLPFFWSTPMGLVAAELGSAIPQEGGYYKWVQRACGEFWGFQAGWWRTISIYFDNTIYVVLAGSYLAMVAVVGFANWNANPFVPFIPPDSTLLESIGSAIAIGMWVYSGYESVSTVAGEISNPQTIPRATLISVPLIMAVYILPTMAGLASIGNWQQWAPEGGLSYGDVVTQVLPAFGLFFVIVAVSAQFSIFNTYIASGSRGFFALAEDHLAPRVLVRCSKKHGVPYIAVLSLGIFSLIACIFPFGVIVVVDMMLLMSAYALIFISGCILRVKEGSLPRPFRVPLGTRGFIAMCIPPLLIAFAALFMNGTDYFVGGMIAIVTGPVAYCIFRRIYGGLTKVDPANHPVNPRTRLAVGDLKRMAWMFAGLTMIGAIASLFLPWYDDPEYYQITYGIDGLFEFMIESIRWITVASGLLALTLYALARKVEP